MPAQTTRFSLLALCGAAMAAAPPLPALAQPATIYAINNYTRDSTDQDLLLHAWKRMGFLDATSGKPATREANGDLKLNGNVVGSEIVRDGRVIGWKKADGTIETYDLSGGANFRADCWERVKVGGTIDIMKHGLSGHGSGWTDGGSLHLDSRTVGDKGAWFNGFSLQVEGQHPGPGTSRLRDTGPYLLGPRNNANVKIVFSVCFAGARARSGDIERFSIAQTAGHITGVSSTVSTTQAVGSGVTIGIEGLNQDAQNAVPATYFIIYQDLVAKKEIAEVRGNSNDEEVFRKRVKAVNDWIYNFPALERWNRVRAKLDDLGFTENAELPLFRMRPKVLPGEIVIPQAQTDRVTPSRMSIVLDQGGGQYDWSEDLYDGIWPRILVPQDALDREVEIQTCSLPPQVPVTPADDAWPASIPIFVTASNVDGTGSAPGGLSIELPFNPLFPDPHLFRFTGSVWIEQAVDSIDRHYGRLTFTPSNPEGVYQVFSPLRSLCPADFDRDGFTTAMDFDLYVAEFQAGGTLADFDRDGFISGMDFDAFSDAFKSPCE